MNIFGAKKEQMLDIGGMQVPQPPKPLPLYEQPAVVLDQEEVSLVPEEDKDIYFLIKQQYPNLTGYIKKLYKGRTEKYSHEQLAAGIISILQKLEDQDKLLKETKGINLIIKADKEK